MSAPANILIFMVDELAGTLMADGPAPFLHAPNLRALAERGVTFANAYSPSPLCVPARAAFMSGQLPSRTGVYDNAAELAAEVPTFAHYLRRAGYLTILAGKMHFVGPDQLHGFEERLTTDIYPADFGWTPDWTRPDERIDWWYHNLGTVTGAGTAETTNQLEFDDEVAYRALACVRRLARRSDPRPFCLTVSFTHPHDPYVARRRYCDLYDPDSLPGPAVAAMTYDEQDPHGQRLMRMNDYTHYDIREAHVRNARHAYFANVSYLDEKIGEILQALRDCRLDQDTVVVFCSDHGDLLGERGLWFKMSFLEGSARVPLLFHAPQRYRPRNVTAPASLLDVLPTLLDIAGVEPDPAAADLDGASLLPLLEGEAAEQRTVIAEYMAEGSVAPMLMVRDARHKLVTCPADPPQLFDLEVDPGELVNLAGDGDHAERLAALSARAETHWDVFAVDADVRRSQARRRLVYAALREGRYHPWDHQPHEDASQRYMRNHMDLNVLERNARAPRERE